VTIVEMLPHLLPAEEESSSKLLERALRRRGIAPERVISKTDLAGTEAFAVLGCGARNL
jgi:dihydrolipoamide dehydrogenase